MPATPRWLQLALWTLFACCVCTPALAVSFSSSCDRFEIDGSAFGSADGAFDFVDEFNNGTFSPEWFVLLGSAVETGGDAVVHDPGTPVQLGPTALQISTIENLVHEVGDGDGDFTMNSYWSPTLPAIDSEFHMQLYSDSPIIEAAGLTVNNYSPEIATQQGHGTLAGCSMSQSLTHGVGTGFTTVELDTVAIDPMSVTGPIVLRMSFDDATNMLTCAFSLDGGTTFQSPFPAMHVFNGGVVDYDLLLGAAGLVRNSVPPPTSQTVPLQLFLVKNPGDPAARRVTYKTKSPSSSGNFIVGDPSVGGARLNLKLDAVTQCFLMPRSGWAPRSHRTFSYDDPLGTYGPVRKATLKQNGSGAIQNKVVIVGDHGPVYIVPPGPGVQGDGNFTIGGGTQYCSSTAGGTIRPNDARTFKARNAPAPASCNVAACSPSGAFLDEKLP